MEAKPCAYCRRQTANKIVHRITSKEFPFCLFCIKKELYNTDLFYNVYARGSVPKAKKWSWK